MIAAIIRIGFALMAAPSGNTIGATTALMPQREPVVKVSAATRTKAIAGKTGPPEKRFCNRNNKICHSHSLRYFLKYKGNDQKDQNRKHICKTTDNQIKEIIQRNHFLRYIKHETNDQGNHNSQKQVLVAIAMATNTPMGITKFQMLPSSS